MKKIILCIVLLSAATMAFTMADFFTSQLEYSRVRQANATKGSKVAKLFETKGIPLNNFDLFLRGFKDEKVVEVWVKDKSALTYQLLTTYSFCATTGKLGPKRKSGDKQMPEGFYVVDRFNPESMYHLSFRISYPNKSDLKFADVLNPGNNIFIHGDCITIGCIPIGNDNIEELYLIAAHAKSADGGLNVHLFPNRMTDANYAELKKEYGDNDELLTFWSWLKPGFDAFEKTRTVPSVSIEEDGSYKVQG
jgi:murein L,D-transpeptidase YafK